MISKRKKSIKPKHRLRILLIVLVFLLLLAFLPILIAGETPCAYDDSLLGASEADIAAEWTRVYQQEDNDTIAVETQVYKLWQKENEQLVTVFGYDGEWKGRVCDYLIRDQATGELRGSLAADCKTLPTLLKLRFGIQPDSHYYDVGSGEVIDSWLTCDGKIIVWFDSSEIMVHDAFTLKNAAEYQPLIALNWLVHLPYTLMMLLYYRVFK